MASLFLKIRLLWFHSAKWLAPNLLATHIGCIGWQWGLLASLARLFSSFLLCSLHVKSVSLLIVVVIIIIVHCAILTRGLFHLWFNRTALQRLTEAGQRMINEQLHNSPPVNEQFKLQIKTLQMCLGLGWIEQVLRRKTKERSNRHSRYAKVSNRRDRSTWAYIVLGYKGAAEEESHDYAGEIMIAWRFL